MDKFRGAISFFRLFGNFNNLYGTNIEHDSCVRLQIDQVNECGERKETIIKLDMTEKQFAELLTNFNQRFIPCTIRYLSGETIPSLENKINFIDIKIENEKADNKIKEQLNKFQKFMDNFMEKKSFTKEEKNEIYQDFLLMKTYIVGFIPNMFEMLMLKAEEIKTSVKKDIDSWITKIKGENE